MDWIKLKYKQLIKWFMYFLMYRAYWKKLWISESDNANWEILNNSDKKTVTLYYIPEDDYTEKDIKIEVPYEQFGDLVKFIIRIR